MIFIHHFFSLSLNTNKLSAASYFLFNDYFTPNLLYESLYNIGDDIYTINSNLAVISYLRFSRTYAKGVSIIYNRSSVIK